MKLEGLSQLREILESKIFLFKTFRTPAGADVSSRVSKIVKSYRNTQRALFQKAVDEINKLEKKILKKYKPLSFKTVMKTDQRFAMSLLLAFRITRYEDLIAKGMLEHAVLLWIVRNVNKAKYHDVNPDTFPDFISKTFEDVKNLIQVTEDDFKEYTPLYRSLFPVFLEKVPEIYEKGDWSVENFIIAGTVKDRLEFIRPSSNELFLLDKVVLN
ncbi:unnamed protein product [Ambrosiozyma monospora]|uniref:Unnamed protein product n=1 Tax=Ambrosiozyma monospora TaxID=43982 RepID=A0ACB5TBF0_AMBMO|nr:unnamed protein product [Ambrosiozyma monospora]